MREVVVENYNVESELVMFDLSRKVCAIDCYDLAIFSDQYAVVPPMLNINENFRWMMWYVLTSF